MSHPTKAPDRAQVAGIDDVLIEGNHIGYLLYDVAREWSNAYAEVVKPLGLTRPQARVIAQIARYPGISQKELADILSVGTMSITGILDRMEEKNLIKRGMDPTDRRVRRVFLTPVAKDLLDDMRQYIDQLTSAATQSISENDLQRFSELLLVLRGNLVELTAYLANHET